MCIYVYNELYMVAYMYFYAFLVILGIDNDFTILFRSHTKV